MAIKRKGRSIGISLVLILTAFVGLQVTGAAAGQSPVANADAGSPYEGYECNSFMFDASFSYDPDGDALQYRWNFDGTWTEWSQMPWAEYTWYDDFSGFVILEVSDGTSVSSASVSVSVLNVAPFILSIDSPSGLIEIGSEVMLTVHCFDGDMREQVPSLDTCTAGFSWGDGASSSYAVGAGAVVVSGSHVYANGGDYIITVVLTDDDGGVSEAVVHLVVNQTAQPAPPAPPAPPETPPVMPPETPPEAPPATPPEAPPADPPKSLVQTLLDLNLKKGLQTSLLAKLGIIDPLLDPKKIHIEMNKLGAFMNEVKAQRGKQLTIAQADVLLSSAQALMDSLKAV
jgi:hypothetical protein